MVEMGKECSFPLNFDMLRMFTPHKTAQNGVTANQIAERLFVFQSRGRVENSLWSRNCSFIYQNAILLNQSVIKVPWCKIFSNTNDAVLVT